MLKVKHDLVKFNKPRKPMSVGSFVMREVNGKDEEQAALIAKAKGGAASMYEELIRLSLVEVDGQPVNNEPGVPYAGFDTWNTRTRTFVQNAFRALNGIDEKEELSDFLESGEVMF